MQLGKARVRRLGFAACSTDRDGLGFEQPRPFRFLRCDCDEERAIRQEYQSLPEYRRTVLRLSVRTDDGFGAISVAYNNDRLISIRCEPRASQLRHLFGYDLGEGHYTCLRHEISDSN